MVEYAHKVYDENLFGAHTNNISARVDSESMLITKSGVKFKDLTVEDIIEVKFNETDKCPSDTLKDALLHVKLYGARQDVGAIMITSPVFALTVANKKSPFRPFWTIWRKSSALPQEPQKPTTSLAFPRRLKAAEHACFRTSVFFRQARRSTKRSPLVLSLTKPPIPLSWRKPSAAANPSAKSARCWNTSCIAKIQQDESGSAFESRARIGGLLWHLPKKN